MLAFMSTILAMLMLCILFVGGLVSIRERCPLCRRSVAGPIDARAFRRWYCQRCRLIWREPARLEQPTLVKSVFIAHPRIEMREKMRRIA